MIGLLHYIDGSEKVLKYATSADTVEEVLDAIDKEGFQSDPLEQGVYWWGSDGSEAEGIRVELDLIEEGWK